ncbi:T9SS type A sorting domain-containing protein [bacterium]|nr:T9SS type A sorting domain-containing protein [bacterium]
MRGLGLSGHPAVLDTVAEHGEPVWCLALVQVPEGWQVTGVGADSDSPDSVRLWLYDTSVPSDDPSQGLQIAIDPSSTEFDVDSGLLGFSFDLPSELAVTLRSTQIELVVLGLDADQAPQATPAVVSYLDVGEVEAINDPIDEFHWPYLAVEPRSASRPEIHEPVEGDTLTQNFEVVFDQPLDAREGSVTIMIREFPSEGGLLTHLLSLEDSRAGEGKTVVINSLDLAQSAGVAGIFGAPSLVHRAEVELSIFYALSEGVLSDTAIVAGLYSDLQTDPCTLTEPDLGSSSPYPDVRVIFRLEEQAHLVNLIFERDTLSTVEDSMSPHVLTLLPQYNSPGEHYLILDGTDIGTGGPNILLNQNGLFDALVSQVIYRVSVSYQDVVGNSAAADSNYGFIWPYDSTTIRPELILPVDNQTENETIWVQFNLPEAPQIGSVYLTCAAFPPLPGSPQTIYLGALSQTGTTGFYLRGNALDLSGPPVTQVIGDPVLVHGHAYVLRVFYQDYLGNLVAGSSGRRMLYDEASDLPTLVSPEEGATLLFLDQQFVYSIPEEAAPGTLKLIFEQTAGPDIDVLSPHVVYLSDIEQGENKSVFVNPSFLTVGDGIDSVHNSGSLIGRGTYKITVEYSDTLLNPAGSDTRYGYYFASGSTVSIRGGESGSEVRPGEGNYPLFHLGLTAQAQSAVRSVAFSVEGGLTPTDVIESGFILWESVDSILSISVDAPVDTLDEWFGGEMVFDSFTVLLNDLEKFLIVGGRFSVNADRGHEAHLVIPDADHVECSGDPVNCSDCPLGTPDFALPVNLVSITTRPDTSFGSLVISWTVASETNNLGFRLWRQLDGESDWQMSADYTTSDQLHGSGSSATARDYAYVDHGLTPGSSYRYKLDAISMEGLVVHPLDGEAVGTVPNLPTDFRLVSAYPNPFNSEITIHFVLPVTEFVELEIFNILGHKVRTVLHGQMPASEFHVRWDSRDDNRLLVPTGIYFCRLTVPGLYTDATKLLLIR